MVDEQDAHILIVDDTAFNAQILSMTLTRAGYRTHIAENGQQALERVATSPPDLILLDVMMPVMDGFTTCQYLKQAQYSQHIPIIFMTSLNDAVSKIKGFEMGAVDYITKPIQTEELLARVRTHLTMNRLQTRLETQNAQLEAQNIELTAFSRTIAHDLKNPLTSMINLIDFLIEGEGHLDDKQIRHLQHISHASHKMMEIIKGLLLLSGISKQTMELRPLDMGQIIQQAQQRLHYLFTEYKGTLETPTNWPVVYGHAQWLEEVWVNYLSNGLKYGGRPPRLRLGAMVLEDNLVKFWVQDNGKGLDEEMQQNIFSLHHEPLRGRGLGLSLVQRIISKLHGTVGVESAVGQGCTFYFTLPVQRGM